MPAQRPVGQAQPPAPYGYPAQGQQYPPAAPWQQPYQPQQYGPPVPMYVQMPVAVHPQQAVTTRYIGPGFHIGHLLGVLFTGGLWLPVYLIAWWHRSRPTSVTTYR
jgi:hypothetical protein